MIAIDDLQLCYVPGCRWIARMTAPLVVEPAFNLVVFDGITHDSKLFQSNGRSVPPRDDNRTVSSRIGTCP